MTDSSGNTVTYQCPPDEEDESYEEPEFSNLGDDCYYDASICDTDDTTCVTWSDSMFGDMATCENCTEGSDRVLKDSYGILTSYQCPLFAEPTPVPLPVPVPTPAPTQNSAPNPAPEGLAEEASAVLAPLFEKAAHISMSAAILLAAPALMA